MRTLSQQFYAFGAILFVIGCGGEVGSPRHASEQGGEGGGSSGSASNGGSHKGGSAGSAKSAATSKGGATSETKSSSEEEESDGVGGHSDPKGAGGNATGGRNSGGSTNTSKGGAQGSGGSTAKGGATNEGAGGKSVGTGGKSVGAGGKSVGTGGGSPGTGAGPTSTDAGSSSGEVDCAAAMPTGGTSHTGNSQGGKDNLAWQIWSNGGSGTLTTFSVPAFTAAWNNSGDYLGRMGFEWGNSGKAYTAYGDIKIDYTFKKNGSGGAYSYIGVYGWSTNPCIEWYIVEDSFSAMPFNTGTQPSGTADIDGGTYNLVKRNTSGTGGNRCGNVTNWDQFYSIRTKSKNCGTISVSEHFKTWDGKGWKLGNLLEVKMLVEAAGGQGSVDFPIANVTTTQ